MEDEIILRNIIKKYPEALNDRKMLKALLHDFFLQDQLKRNILLMVYDADIISDMQSQHQINESEYYRFIKLMVQEFGITKENAEKGVSIWLRALEIPFDRPEGNDISQFMNESALTQEKFTINKGVRIDTDKGSYRINVKGAHVMDWTTGRVEGTKIVSIQCEVENIDYKNWEGKLDSYDIKSDGGFQALDKDGYALESYGWKGEFHDGLYEPNGTVPVASKRRISLPYYAPIDCDKLTVIINKKHSQEFSL